jgi:type IV pilus assembly protein PilV
MHTPLRIRQQHGLTLVEILVAVLVISVGLLGVAGLHSFSLRSNYDALMRSQASSLAADIADRMRANRGQLAGYATRKAGDPDPDVTGTPPMSSTDVNEWLKSIRAALPNGDGEVTVTGDLARIRILWGERSSNIEFATETEV